jgi:hypothetical protein
MLFSLFARLAKERGWDGARREVEREKLTVEAFGSALSWSTFDNREVDRMKAVLNAELGNLEGMIAVAKFNKHDAAQAAHRPQVIPGRRHPARAWASRYESETNEDDPGERRRLLYVIGQLFEPSLIRAIAVDLYDAADWQSLSLPKLTALRDLLMARLSKFLTRVKKGELPCDLGIPLFDPATGRPVSNLNLIGALQRWGKPVCMSEAQINPTTAREPKAEP